MADRDKVIKGLECCASTACRECPYSSDCVVDDLTGTTYLAADALELLKEQETKKKNRLPYSPDSNVQWT